MKKDVWGVHQTHCCFRHGYKYDYNIIQKECPVYAGKIKQEYPCESCDNDKLIKLFFGCYIELSEPIITERFEIIDDDNCHHHISLIEI